MVMVMVGEEIRGSDRKGVGIEKEDERGKGYSYNTLSDGRLDPLRQSGRSFAEPASYFWFFFGLCRISAASPSTPHPAPRIPEIRVMTIGKDKAIRMRIHQSDVAYDIWVSPHCASARIAIGQIGS